MAIRQSASIVKNKLNQLNYKVRNIFKEKFECPICSYIGQFEDISPSTGYRKHAMCPKCGALERHRIQYFVLNDILSKMSTNEMKVLHFAPEPFFQEFLSKQFGKYENADYSMRDVDHNVDLQQLPFDDGTYDFILASHVLEHIPDDEKAISEIRRVLKPNGMAVLPVPIVAEKTIEYLEPNPHEAYHVRAPGLDYFKRYETYFSKVMCFNSESLPWKYQLFIYEDRSNFPNKKSPLRPSMQGDKHNDIVPVCFV